MPGGPQLHRYTTVGVFHGVVAVANISNPAQAVLVNEGYETTVACEAPATSPAPLGMEEMGRPVPTVPLR